MGDAPPRTPSKRASHAEPPVTVPGPMAAREAILRRAHQAATTHLAEKESDQRPISSDWSDFFDQKKSVPVPDRSLTFNVYTAGPRHEPEEDHKTPVVLCIHGGGYTALSFALIAEDLRERCGMHSACWCCCAHTSVHMNAMTASMLEAIERKQAQPAAGCCAMSLILGAYPSRSQ